MNKALSLACVVAAPVIFSTSAFAEFDYKKYIETDGSFKRFSVSAGWLHANPSGDATPIKNTTAIQDGSSHENGSVRASTVRDVIDPNQDKDVYDKVYGTIDGLISDDSDPDLGALNASGSTVINGLQNFATAGTGLESDDVDTVGLLFNYFFTDNWSLEVKAGIPPKVDILGKGTVIAPFEGTVSPGPTAVALGLSEFDIKKNIEITDMTQGSKASTARAWLPAAEIHYQFGKSGVNKFRPYVGAGLMYAHFNDLKLNSGIRQDLTDAGHMIQNIKNGQAGQSLQYDGPDGRVTPSDSGMRIKVEADSAWAPMLTLGATYDFDESWFAVGSVTYAKLDSETTITVNNDAGDELIRAKSKIDIDPYITYLGVGYRF
ncbi:OmpW/AlkL family protein [Psychrobacter sp. FDAARGOS_221]|uniref:OmpW/AlkL family protein n=1 Tax=Psychrobacter sp. FDAARGOS_221 TaxID=1975705 RepID=UPI000BB539AD|nr:OmpW family outer membrane protein [Psychrobacter sp. FDAARGOS_221]PNK60720.1 OmpW family protein [Psychrobacter sp. FDAARGOS_221]